MKIALYLGSFNPFHNGHLEVVKTALNDFKMDKVVIVPTMQNPWKKEKVLDIDKRINIIANSLYYKFKHGTVVYSRIEKELIPPYYSYATLHALKNKYYGNEIFVLCAEDTIKDIPNWTNGEQIIKDYNFIVVDFFGGKTKETKLSSSFIREMLRNRNKMDEHYLDEKLARYVNPNVINLLKEYYE